MTSRTGLTSQALKGLQPGQRASASSGGRSESGVGSSRKATGQAVDKVQRGMLNVPIPDVMRGLNLHQAIVTLKRSLTTARTEKNQNGVKVLEEHILLVDNALNLA